jgi:3-hydroxyacyl-CoA dehydrogenase / 3-hydroxy-2-methylbutyryl-CoA dehydrogenase
MDIKAKTAIITGGASGLGEGAVRRLHGLGASVVIADLNVSNGETLAAELGNNAVFAKMDVTNSEEVKAGVELAIEKFGALHILVNSAGCFDGKQTLGKEGPHDLDLFKKVIDINLIGTFDVIRQAAFQMQNNDPGDGMQDRGVIVNVGSVAGFEGQKGFASYSASKAAVSGMTLSIACDLSAVGIRICTVAPGTFDTSMIKFMPAEVISATVQLNQFPKRLGVPDEFAMLVQQIVENPMLNGESIRLDGAMRMRTDV